MLLLQESKRTFMNNEFTIIKQICANKSEHCCQYILPKEGNNFKHFELSESINLFLDGYFMNEEQTVQRGERKSSTFKILLKKIINIVT